MPDLLLEIGTEEIPASYIPPALHALSAKVHEELLAARISHGAVQTLATPRRLTLYVADLAARQEAVTFEIAGPPEAAAYDKDGKPTRALEGFARSQGVAAAAVAIKETRKGRYCVVEKSDAGKNAAHVLADVLPAAIRALPFPKSMYWSERRLTFARPIRNLVALLGQEIVPFRIGTVSTHRQTHGHPFLAPGTINLKSANLAQYTKVLEDAYVRVDAQDRIQQMRAQIESLLKKHGSTTLDEALLQEVAFMVEWPGVVEGTFDPAFLELPDEVLIESMRYHQQYFPVRNAEGQLVNRFIAVHNRTDAQAEAIRAGTQRVLRARLADARFFWDHDRATPLEEFAAKLDGIEYLRGLGSMADKSERLAKLCQTISPHVPAKDYRGNAQKHSAEAGRLCKADLLTEMVGEFPRLQGIMGGFYALEQKKDPEVALAIAEHYLPRHPQDLLPKTKLGVALSLADKFDHLAAGFALGLKPSGSSDPFALRRQAVGILRIFRKQELSVGLGEWAGAALAGLAEKVDVDADAVRDQIVDFILDRFADQYLRDGGRREVFQACRFNPSDGPTELAARMDALEQLTQQTFWPSLQELVERTYNIAKPLPGEDTQPVAESLLAEAAERTLWQAYEECREPVQAFFDAGNYADASRHYETALAEPVHWFFEKVFVNVEDPKVRDNRINLLKNINRLFTRNFANLALFHVPEDAKPKRGKA